MAKEPNTSRKKHGCLISLFSFFLICLLGIGGAYLFFQSKVPDSVAFTQTDVNNFHQKMGIEAGDYAFTLFDFMEGTIQSRGQQNLDATFTSEEITGGFQTSSSYTKSNDPTLHALSLIPSFTTERTLSQYKGSGLFDGVNVRFTAKDELEIFGTLTPTISKIYAYAPELESYAFAVNSVVDAVLYVKLQLTHTAADGIQFNVQSLTINGIPLPRRLIDAYQGDVANQLNRAIERIEGLEIQALEITEGSLYFKGMVPEKMLGVANTSNE